MSATNQARSYGRKLDGDVDDAGDIEGGDGIKQRIKDRAEELVADGREAIENAGSKVRGQVRDRPLTSLAVAGGIGLLIGMLIARKR